MMKSNGALKHFTNFVNVFACFFLFYFSFYIPQYGWDLIGHVGSALSFGIADSVQLHATVYSIVRETVPEPILTELLTAKSERVVWANDAEAFRQVLPFYQPRIALTIPVFLSYKLGFNPVVTIAFFSSLAVAIGYMYFFALAKKCIPIDYLLLLPLLALLAGSLEVARFEGADSIAFLGFAMFSYYLYKRSKLALLLLALLPFSRSDMILLVILLLPLCLYVFQSNKISVIVATVIALLAYVGVNKIFSNYGWEKQFYVAVVEYQAYPADVETFVNLKVYMTSLLRQSVDLVYNKTFLFIVFSYLVLLFDLLKSPRGFIKFDRKRRILTLLMVLSGFYIGLHYLVFPLMHIRYFAGQYLLILIVFLAMISQTNDKWSNE